MQEWWEKNKKMHKILSAYKLFNSSSTVPEFLKTVMDNFPIEPIMVKERLNESWVIEN
uniref:Uncharacterized protein n=1 Tax=Cyprinus carpio TaxID=7962 RepID=A0A8C1S691_CYPCA